jgi:hypothetical protein
MSTNEQGIVCNESEGMCARNDGGINFRKQLTVRANTYYALLGVL